MTEGPMGQGPLQAGSPLRTPQAAAIAGIVSVHSCKTGRGQP